MFKKIFSKQKLNNLLDIIYSRKCILCDNQFLNTQEENKNTTLCKYCLTNIPKHKNNYNKESWIYSIYKYKDANNKYRKINVKKILNRIKFNNDIRLANELGEKIYCHISEIICEHINIISEYKNNTENTINIMLIPVPLSREKLKIRGYNQVQEILKEVIKNKSYKYKSININLYTQNILTRNKNTNALKDIHGIDKRIREISGSMSITENQKVMHDFEVEVEKCNLFIILDDITTTGSTLYEARRALLEHYKEIEKENIIAITIAH